MAGEVTVRVPASSANLGPGFDCLALALDIWNEATFLPVENGLTIEIEGEGKGRLARDRSNLVIRAAAAVYERYKRPMPGLQVRCANQIPMGSGLGSSAATNLLGLLGANALIGSPLSREEILDMAIRLEGHPDNAAAALNGGLAVIADQGDCCWLVRRYDLPVLQAVLILPEIDLPTPTARAALPKQVALHDAVYNLGRVGLVIEALRAGDMQLLVAVMDDRLHQPYRLPLISGAAGAIAAARRMGAAAAISGAGPSVIAFSREDPASIGKAMVAEFQQAGIRARAFHLQTTNQGAQVLC
jgi:homoserine kinase